jgi:RNA polymerase sigma factor (TIGR02999 family)
MTLQPTVLLHETYLRLENRSDWASRTHFIATASRAMRHVLVDYVRHNTAAKRGRNWLRIPLNDASAEAEPDASLVDLLELDHALNNLAQLDVRKARVVELRFFGGLEFEEIAESLGVALPTVKRDWRFARAWLYDQIRDG